MNIKNIVLSVIYSAIAAAVAAVVLKSSLALPAEVLYKTIVIIFVPTVISGLLISMSGSSSAASGGAEYVDDENDDREGGSVKWFNVTKGFGFITRDQGDDVFVHFRSIRGTGHRSLSEGQRVRFEVVESEKGLQAEDVSIVR